MKTVWIFCAGVLFALSGCASSSNQACRFEDNLKSPRSAMDNWKLRRTSVCGKVAEATRHEVVAQKSCPEGS